MAERIFILYTSNSPSYYAGTQTTELQLLRQFQHCSMSYSIFYGIRTKRRVVSKDVHISSWQVECDESLSLVPSTATIPDLFVRAVQWLCGKIATCASTFTTR
jgi:hypothetical protein